MMAILDATNRRRVWAHAMRRFGWPGLTKADLRAAVDATDQWIEDNATTYALALPLAYRQGTTAAQKTILFCWVAMRRAGLLRVEED